MQVPDSGGLLAKKLVAQTLGLRQLLGGIDGGLVQDKKHQVRYIGKHIAPGTKPAHIHQTWWCMAPAREQVTRVEVAMCSACKKPQGGWVSPAVISSGGTSLVLGLIIGAVASTCESLLENSHSER